MAKDKKIVWVEASAELAAEGNAKWSVSSVVVPTRPPTKKVEESPSSAMPSEDGHEDEPVRAAASPRSSDRGPR